jgi:hypothetical protein
VGGFVEQDDAFAHGFVFAGTHTGPFLLPDGTELPPTGKRVEIRGMELVQVRDGRSSSTTCTGTNGHPGPARSHPAGRDRVIEL